METKPQETLELAFRHLDTFSVPGFGTFKRKYFPARVDTASKQVFPPSEEFVMEPGDEFVAILENFFFRFYKIKIDEAKDMVTRLRGHVVHELKTSGKLLVDGYGELRMSNGKEFSFTAKPGDVGAASQFFGLAPLDFTLGDAAAKPKAKEVEKEKKVPTPAVIVPEQEPPRSVAAAVSAQGAKAQKPKEERSRAGLWAFLFLLLAVGATAGIVYRAELGSGIQQLGWFSGSDEDPENPVVDSLADDSSAHNGETLADAVGHDSTDEANIGEDQEDPIGEEVVEDDPIADGPVAEEPVFEEPVVEDVVEEPVVAFDETVGSRPSDGQYYLIVKSSKDPDDAKSIARNIGGKILRPRYSGNYYRISVFNSPNKSNVIQKMVDLKSKFGKSWIYWNGM